MDRDENSNSDSGDIVAYLRSNNNGSKKRKRDIDGDADSTVGPKPKDREEIELENMLFGDTTIVNKLGKELKHAFGDADELKLDLGQHDDLLDEDEIPDEEDDSEDEEDRKKRRKLDPSKVKPAWQDEDDENAVVNIVNKQRLRKLRTARDEKEVSGKEYSDRLREQFNKINKHANLKWAQYQIVDEDPTLEMLRSTGSLVGSKDKRKLEPKNIAIGRLKDANIREPAKAVIQSVKFHPNGQLLLTAGLDKKLRLFQIDGKENEKLQTVFFADLPLTNALFTPNGKEIIATGTDKHFYLYELMSGKVEKVDQVIGRMERKWRGCQVSPDNQYICLLGDDGNVVVLSNKTKQWAFNMKMNGLVNSIAFSKDSKYMYSAGGKTNGEIYQWDLGTRRCVRRFADEGSIYNTALTVSHNTEGHALMAAGSDNGVVNIYDMADPNFDQSKNPKPIKAIMNLTTEINHVQFNHDAQLLALSSMEKRNALRLVHVPTCTVYENWPKEKTPLTRVSSFDFSPNSSMLAVGNIHGKVLLYKLHHYHQNK